MAEIPELSTHMVGTYVFTPATVPYSDSTRKQLRFPCLLSPGLSQSLLKSLEMFLLISTSSGWCLPASSCFCHHCYNDQQQFDFLPIDIFRRWLFQLGHTPNRFLEHFSTYRPSCLWYQILAVGSFVWKSACSFGLAALLYASNSANRGSFFTGKDEWHTLAGMPVAVYCNAAHCAAVVP